MMINLLFGLELSDSVTDYYFINAYLPYCCTTNIDKYLSHLSAVEAMYKLLNSSNTAILGDFIASDFNSFGKLLNDFCCNNNFKLSDKLLLPSNSFTYYSEAHSTTSWLDHCLSSHSVHSHTTVKPTPLLLGWIIVDPLIQCTV